MSPLDMMGQLLNNKTFWAQYPISKSESSHPLEETNFGCLCPGCHYLIIIEISQTVESWNVG